MDLVALGRLHTRTTDDIVALSRMSSQLLKWVGLVSDMNIAFFVP